MYCDCTVHKGIMQAWFILADRSETVRQLRRLLLRDFLPVALPRHPLHLRHVCPDGSQQHSHAADCLRLVVAHQHHVPAHDHDEPGRHDGRPSTQSRS